MAVPPWANLVVYLRADAPRRQHHEQCHYDPLGHAQPKTGRNEPPSAPARNRQDPLPASELGFGRIVVSEIDTPNMYKLDERWYKTTM